MSLPMRKHIKPILSRAADKLRGWFTRKPKDAPPKLDVEQQTPMSKRFFYRLLKILGHSKAGKGRTQTQLKVYRAQRRRLSRIQKNARMVTRGGGHRRIGGGGARPKSDPRNAATAGSGKS